MDHEFQTMYSLPSCSTSFYFMFLSNWVITYNYFFFQTNQKAVTFIANMLCFFNGTSQANYNFSFQKINKLLWFIRNFYSLSRFLYWKLRKTCKQFHIRVFKNNRMIFICILSKVYWIIYFTKQSYMDMWIFFLIFMCALDFETTLW